MPHFIIEYSANLEPAVDIAALCEAVRATAAGMDCFPTPGIRVRAFRADHVAIADGDPQHGFVDISIRLREGRPQEVKETACEGIFEAARAFLAPYMGDHSLALSLEMRDIDASLSPKTGTVRRHLPGREFG